MSRLEWLQFLASLGVQGLVLTMIARACDRRCRAAQAKTRVWNAYYLCLLGLFAAGMLLPRIRWPNPWALLPPQDLVTAVHVLQAVAMLAVVVWLSGTCLLLAAWMAGFLRLQVFLHGCGEVSEIHHRRIRILAGEDFELPFRRDISYRIGPEEIGPFCYQLHRPIIVLPPSLLAGGGEELRQVLKHELTHLETQHPLQTFIQRVVQAGLWPLPGVRETGRLAALAREFVCDEAATTHGASTASYLRTLLRFAHAKQAFSHAVLPITRDVSDLRLRAERLARARTSETRPDWRPPLMIVAAAASSILVSLPLNPLAPEGLGWSPWPTWSAAALHAADVTVKDFDAYDPHRKLHELEEAIAPTNASTP